MGEDDIRSYLRDARTKGRSEQELIRKATAMARVLHRSALGRMRSEERNLLFALGRMVGQEGERVFVSSLCRQVLSDSCATRAMENLRSLLTAHGGIPTFFSSAGRLRIKAALMAPRGMQEAALREVRRVFRSTLGELVVDDEEAKLGHRVATLRKAGARLLLQPLEPTVYGEEGARAYRQVLAGLLQAAPGIGLAVEAAKLHPGLDAAAPGDGVQVLKKRLGELVSLAAKTGGRLLLRAARSDLQALALMALRGVADAFPGDEKEFPLEAELAGHLPMSCSLLRELAEWAEKRSGKGYAPLRVHLIEECHRGEDSLSAAVYGDGAALFAPGDETLTGYAQLLRAAMQCSPRAITPVVHSQEPIFVCYALLSWAQSGREGVAPLAFDHGTGSHIGRVVAGYRSEVELLAPWSGGGRGAELFELRLLSTVSSLAQRGNNAVMAHVSSASSSALDWDALARPLRSAATPMAKERVAPHGMRGACNMGSLLVQAEVESFYAAAAEEQNRAQAPLPLAPGGVCMGSPLTCIHRSLIAPGVESYRYQGADYAAVNETLQMAQEMMQREASSQGVAEKARVLRRSAAELRKNSARWVALLVRDVGCTMRDAVQELRDAQEALLYAGERAELWEELRDGAEAVPAGIVVVIGGVAHPLSEAARAIAAAWMAGNTIIFKPAAYATLLGTRFAEFLSQVGIRVLCIPCGSEDIERRIMSDERVSLVLCSGTVDQARRYASLAPYASVLCTPSFGPGVYLAESCDREKAVRELVRASLRRSGQCPSAPHLVFLHASLYDDPAVRAALADAVSLYQAQPTHLQSAGLGPLSSLLSEPQRALLSSPPGGEADWCVMPHAAKQNGLLWNAGLCAHAEKHREIPAHGQLLPVIGLVRVESCEAAANMQRRLAQGSHAIIFSEDAEEIARWEKLVDCRRVAINCFPSFRSGSLPLPTWCAGLCAANGPLLGTVDSFAALCRWQEKGRPGLRSARRQLRFDPKDILPPLRGSDEVMRLSAAADSISYWWEHLFCRGVKLPETEGMQSELIYEPVRELLRVEKCTSDVDLAILLMAILQVQAQPEISAAAPRPWLLSFADRWGVPLSVASRAEFEDSFPRLAKEDMIVRDPAATPQTICCAAIHGVHLLTAPVLANARIELLYHTKQKTKTTTSTT